MKKLLLVLSILICGCGSQTEIYPVVEDGCSIQELKQIGINVVDKNSIQFMEWSNFSKKTIITFKNGKHLYSELTPEKIFEILEKDK